MIIHNDAIVMTNSIIVTGGAGFIGSNFVLQWIRSQPGQVINLDRLTYAGNPQNLEDIKSEQLHELIVGSINDEVLVGELLRTHRPRAIVHFAAESHVDRSILGPEEFVETNIVGTFRLLQVARSYWSSLAPLEQAKFRFLHISSDEVYGSLGPNDPPFKESSPYAPNSPYAASKAAADHMVRAYHRTYGLPTLIINCSNNYGPRQFPEKFIPLLIINAVQGKELPLYGDGQNVRDWLYIEDHCEAINRVLEKGRPGETYNVGGRSEKTNLQVVNAVTDALSEMLPRVGLEYRSLMRFVTDRPSHDRRYAIDTTKIETDLEWRPKETFETGIRKTVRWYLDNMDWVQNVTSGAYQEWIARNYNGR